MKKNIFTLLICILTLHQLAAQNTGDYRTKVSTGAWTTPSTWERWNGSEWITPGTTEGYPGQYSSQSYGIVTILTGHSITADYTVATTVTAAGLGTLSARTFTQPIEKLVIESGTAYGNGGTLNILTTSNYSATLVNTSWIEINDYGSVNFGSKATLAIPENAILTVGTAAFTGSITANSNIVVGSQWFAVGTSSKAQFNFSELIASGGTLNAIISTPSASDTVYCQNESIPLSGQFTGVSGVTTSGGTTVGVNYYWFLDDNYSTALRSGTMTTPEVNHASYNYPAASITPGTHELRFYTTTYYATTLYYNNEYRSITILETPKLSSVSQPWPGCRHRGANIELNGLIPSTTFTVNYTIEGLSQASTTVSSDNTGKASFELALSIDDHGKMLTVNSLSYTSLGKTCTQALSTNNSTTLSMWTFEGFTWTGRVSNDWHNSDNWCRGTFDETFTIPTAETDVYIPGADSTKFSPVISQANAIANNLTIGNGAELSFAGPQKTLDIKANWTNRGTFIPSSGKIVFSGTAAQTIGGAVETSFYSLEINNNSGVIANNNLSVLKLLTLTSDNVKTSPELVTADRGTLHTGTNILTMADTAYTEGISDVTGIVRRANIQFASRQYTFGSRNTLMTFAPCEAPASYPTEVLAYISIGTAPSWKSNAVLREYHFIQTGGTDCYATIRTSYKDSELNSVTENRLVQWTQFSADGTPEGGYEWGRSNADPDENWVEITNINIGLFPTEKGSTGNSLGANETETLVWNGSVSTEWHNPANWTPNQSPSRLKNVIIPDAATTNNDPLIPLDGPSGYGDITQPEVKTITLEENSILNSDLFTYNAFFKIPAMLNIYGSIGAWVNQGGIYNPNQGAVVLHNDSSQFATASGNTQFHNIILDEDVDLLITANSHIKISGAVTLNGIDATRATVGSISAAENTIEYNGANQEVVIPNETTPRYFNLILSGSGTKIMPNVDLNVFGDFIVSNTVTVNLPAKNLNVYGNVTVNDGTTFAAGTSTINMAGISGQSIGGTTTSLSLYNLTNSNTADTVKVNIGSLSLGGNLTNNGVLDFETNILTGITGTLANSGTIRTANTTASPLPTGKTWSVVSGENTFGIVEYSGAAAQTAVAGTYHNLTVANPTGLTAAGNITMTGNLALNTNASATKGSLDMGAHTLEMGLTGTTTGAGDVSGRVQRTKPESGSFVKDVAYSFGNKNTFIKFLDVVTAKPDMLAVNIKLGTTPTYASSAMLNDYHAIDRTYSFSTSGTATDRTLLQLAYLDSELQENTDESELSFWIAYQLEGVNTSFSRGHTEVDTVDNWMNITGLTPAQYAQTDREFGLANNKAFISWTGNGALAYKGDWSLPGNWDGGVPMANDSVVIPASAASLPDFKGWPSSNGLSSSIPAVAKSITIEENAILNGTGYNITLYGSGDAWVNNGTFNGDTLATASEFSKVIFANESATPAKITGDSISHFHHFEVAANSSIQLVTDTVTFAGNISCNTGSLSDFDTYPTTVIYNGGDQTVILPTGGSGQYHNLTLSGSGTKTLPASQPLSIKQHFVMSDSASTTTTQSMQVDGDFTIGEGASFNAGSQTHFISGDFEINGTFTPGTSTINFYGLSDNEIRTSLVEPAGPISFYNLYIPFIQEGIDVVAKTDIKIDGSLVNQADFELEGNNLSGDMSLINNNGLIRTQSNSLTPLPAGKIWEGTGYVLFNGVNEQTLINGTFNKIEIDNAAGLVQSGNVRINSDLKLTNGLLTTSSSDKLTIDCTAGITGASNTSFINGPLLREYCSTGSKTFPIGKGVFYRPLTLNYTSLNGISTVTAEQFESALPDYTEGTTTDILNTRYWLVNQIGASDYIYSITLDGTGFAAAEGYTNPVVVRGTASSDYQTYRAVKTDEDYTISGQNYFSNFTVGAQQCSAPEIIEQPVEESAIASTGTAEFSVTVRGESGRKIAVQWQRNTGSGFVNINIENPYSLLLTDIAETNDTIFTLSFTPTADMHGDLYQAIVSFENCPNTSLSNTVELKVPVIWTGSVSENWSTAANWSGGVLPESGADIIFAASAANNLVLDADRVIGSLQNESDKAIVIPTGIELLVNDTMPAGDLASKVHIKSAADAANGSLRFAKPDLNTNVNATVEMYSKAEATNKNPASNYRWQFFGIPVQYMPKADPVFYGSWVSRFDETSLSSYWVSLNNNSPLFSWQGYEVTHANPKTIFFSGTLETGNFERGLNYTTTAKYKGQHIFGNPYTTAIDISKIEFGTETEATVYLYNTGSASEWVSGVSKVGDSPGQYVAIPKNISEATTPESGIVRQIPSMQGFLVRKLNNNAENLVNFNMTIDYVTATQKNTTAQRAPRESLPYTIVDVKGSRYSDRMWLFMNENCSHNFENGWDGQKYAGAATSPLIYHRYNNKNLQVQTTNDFYNTELSFRKGEDTQYEISFTHYRGDEAYPQGVYLEDLLTGTLTDISESGSKYVFSTASTDQSNRFRIIHNPDVTTGTETEVSNLSAYVNNKALIVNNFSSENMFFVVYDSTGRNVYQSKADAGTRNSYATGLPEGAYVLHFENGKTFKIILY
ncbi:MAG: hypothetical protein JXR27_04170 [Paludibacteraceae bacterium]|nr:hypothetical protein [Paludibacteraceae bacterium]